MFGFGKERTYDVRITEKERKELEKNMSKRERREFRKRLEESRDELEWDVLCMLEVFDDWDD